MGTMTACNLGLRRGNKSNRLDFNHFCCVTVYRDATVPRGADRGEAEFYGYRSDRPKSYSLSAMTTHCRDDNDNDESNK
jgi:hypothetical protein